MAVSCSRCRWLQCRIRRRRNTRLSSRSWPNEGAEDLVMLSLRPRPSLRPAGSPPRPRSHTEGSEVLGVGDMETHLLAPLPRRNMEEARGRGEHSCRSRKRRLQTSSEDTFISSITSIVCYCALLRLQEAVHLRLRPGPLRPQDPPGGDRVRAVLRRPKRPRQTAGKVPGGGGRGEGHGAAARLVFFIFGFFYRPLW